MCMYKEGTCLPEETFEDTKWVIRSRILKKNRQENDQKKKVQTNDLENTTNNTKDGATRNLLKLNAGAPEG